MTPLCVCFFICVGDLETAEEKYENAKKELEATLAELADVWTMLLPSNPPSTHFLCSLRDITITKLKKRTCIYSSNYQPACIIIILLFWLQQCQLFAHVHPSLDCSYYYSIGRLVYIIIALFFNLSIRVFRFDHLLIFFVWWHIMIKVAIPHNTPGIAW